MIVFGIILAVIAYLTAVFVLASPIWLPALIVGVLSSQRVQGRRKAGVCGGLVTTVLFLAMLVVIAAIFFGSEVLLFVAVWESLPVFLVGYTISWMFAGTQTPIAPSTTITNGGAA